MTESGCPTSRIRVMLGPVSVGPASVRPASGSMAGLAITRLVVLHPGADLARGQAEVLEDGVPVRPGGRRGENGGGELLAGQAEIGGGPRTVMPSQTPVQLGEAVRVPTQVRAEHGPYAGQLTVVARAGEEPIHRVQELMIPS